MARSATEIETEIEQLEKLLSSGARRITIDGVTTDYRDSSEINGRIKQLKEELALRNGETVRGVFKNVSLAKGGAL